MFRQITVQVDLTKLPELERLATEQKISVEDLFKGRGTELLLGDPDHSVRTAAAELASLFTKPEIEKFIAIGNALLALKNSVPKKSGI